MDKVSIIIPCRNEIKYIEKTVETIFDENFTKLDFEVLIIDGLSNDGTEEVLQRLAKKYSQLIILENQNQTTPFAFNIGIKNATGNYFIFVGARFIMCNNYLDTCVEILRTNEIIGSIGGKIRNSYFDNKSLGIGIAMNTPIGVGMNNWRALQKSQFVDTVSCAMYPKRIIEEIGLFDEDLVRNQDDDLNFRLLKHGFKIWLEVSISYEYTTRSTFNHLFKQYFQYGFWKVFVNKKHKAITTFRQLIPPLFIVYIISVIILSAFFIQLSYFLFSILIYLLILLFFGILNGRKNYSLTTSIITGILCLHFGYGLGYLKGFLDFIVFNRKVDLSMKKLTR